MRGLYDSILYVIAMSVVIGGAYLVGRYRHARIGPAYRGDRDAVIWVATVALGALVAFMIVHISGQP